MAHRSGLIICRMVRVQFKRTGVTEILRGIWLFSANKIKTSESVSKKSFQLKLELNSSLWQKLGTFVVRKEKTCEITEIKCDNYVLQ